MIDHMFKLSIWSKQQQRSWKPQFALWKTTTLLRHWRLGHQLTLWSANENRNT
jgi:hypothetical protein